MVAVAIPRDQITVGGVHWLWVDGPGPSRIDVDAPQQQQHNYPRHVAVAVRVGVNFKEIDKDGCDEADVVNQLVARSADASRSSEIVLDESDLASHVLGENVHLHRDGNGQVANPWVAPNLDFIVIETAIILAAIVTGEVWEPLRRQVAEVPTVCVPRVPRTPELFSARGGPNRSEEG